MLFQKNKTYQMDMNTANATLQNVFAACNQAPNTIPFDKLVLRQKSDTKIYNRLLFVTAVVLTFTFLLPVFIVPASTLITGTASRRPVALIDDYIEDNILILTFTGDAIQYEDAYFEFPDGHIEYALSYDASKQTICFRYYDDAEINIYIPIKNDQTLHLLITPQ